MSTVLPSIEYAVPEAAGWLLASKASSTVEPFKASSTVEPFMMAAVAAES
jgi:hypothetical protein